MAGLIGVRETDGGFEAVLQRHGQEVSLGVFNDGEAGLEPIYSIVSLSARQRHILPKPGRCQEGGG